MWHARREARHRRFIPDRQMERAGQRARVRLRKIQFDQRRTNLPITRRSHSVNVIANVIAVRPVRDRVPSFTGRDVSQFFEEGGLAEIAPVGVVAVVAIVELFLRRNHPIPRADLLRQCNRSPKLALRITRRSPDARQRAIAQRAMRRRHHQRAIHTTRIRDEHRLHLPQEIHQRIELHLDYVVHLALHR